MLVVVMPAFKTSQFIVEAATSALAQDDVGLLVVVDDACPERTGAFVADNIDDPRLVVLRMRENGGQYRAINTAIEHVWDQASSIAILDSDDVASPNRFSRTVQLFADDPELMAVAGQMQHVNEHGVDLGIVFGSNYREDPAWTLDQRHGTVMALGSSAFRREVFDVLGGFDPTWGGADTQFFMRAYYAGMKMRFLPEIWGLYRQHEGQATRNLHMDPIRKAYHTKSRGEWTYWRLLKKKGRLQPFHMHTARIVGDADVLTPVRAPASH